MAHSNSARKRIRQNDKRETLNRARKSQLKILKRKVVDAIRGGDVSGAEEHYKVLTKRLDQIAHTSTLHKNNVARIKSRYAKKVNAAKTKAPA